MFAQIFYDHLNYDHLCVVPIDTMRVLMKQKHPGCLLRYIYISMYICIYDISGKQRQPIQWAEGRGPDPAGWAVRGAAARCAASQYKIYDILD